MTMTQRESELLHRYQDFKGRVLTTKSVRHRGGGVRLRIDAFDADEKCLIEAKSSEHRTYVLHAIAQLLDYGRLVPEHECKLVLLPAKPEHDLIELAHSLGIAVCFEVGGSFETMPTASSV